MTLPDLQQLSIKRYEISTIKSSNQHLINHELSIHQQSIKEYLSFHHKYSLTINDRETLTCPLHLPNFINQPDINPQLRYRMVDTLITYHYNLKLSTPTLFQSLAIMDRISCNYIIRDYNYKLIGLVSLWISSKFYDLKRRVPSLKQLIHMTQYRYDKDELIQMELIILKNLNWRVDTYDTMDSIIDNLLFPFLNQLGNDINNFKIWMLIIGELCMFDLDLSMGFSSRELVEAIFPLVVLINDYSNHNRDSQSMENENPLMIKILEYLVNLDGEYPLGINLKYGKNPLFTILQDYLIYYDDHISISKYGNSNNNNSNRMDPYINELMNSRTPVTTTTHSYALPVTPTTPNHDPSQKDKTTLSQKRKMNLFTETEDTPDPLARTSSIKRSRY